MTKARQFCGNIQISLRNRKHAVFALTFLQIFAVRTVVHFRTLFAPQVRLWIMGINVLHSKHTETDREISLVKLEVTVNRLALDGEYLRAIVLLVLALFWPKV